MGIELELGILLILQTILIKVFAPFEVESPVIQRLLRWFIIDAITIGLYYVIGHWALLAVLIPLTAGTIFHLVWCKKHGIHPLKATPRKKYYELRGWKLND